MNSLIERLEKQKKQLPLNDHPSIEWAINILLNKSTMTKHFEILPDPTEIDAYRNFIEKSGWEGSKSDLYKDVGKRIDDAIKDSGSISKKESLETDITELCELIEKFCGETEGYQDYFRRCIPRYITTYQNRISEYIEKMDQQEYADTHSITPSEYKEVLSAVITILQEYQN